MKPLILTITAILISIKVLSQNTQKDSVAIVYIDSLKKISSKVTYDNFHKAKKKELVIKDKVIQIIYYSLDGKGLLKESNYNEDGEQFGWQREYYPNGKMKSERFITGYTIKREKHNNEYYSVKIFDGLDRYYYENGQLKEEAYYTNGEKSGLSTEFFPDGKYKEVRINYPQQ